MDPTASVVGEGRVGPPSRRAWILAGTTAAVVFLIFESVSAFVAVPLREISSVLAHAFLSAIGFPVTRAGTILSTPKATFDVIPACSGSTTLQVLLFLSILWCGIHPRLSPARRLLGIVLAVPLALLANAIRVSALVAVGHTLGGPPDDFVHALTGLIAFALAMLGSFALTQRLASGAERRSVADRTLAWSLGALIAFLSLPFLSWCLESWAARSIDRFGFVFLIVAAGLASWAWMRTTPDCAFERLGTALLALSFVGLIAATLVDVNLLRGLSLILALLSLSLAFKGVRFAASMIPIALLGYLGFPTVSYQLGVLTGWKLTGWPLLFAGKSVLGVLLFVASAALLRRAAPGETPATSRLLPIQVLMAAMLAALQTYLLFGVSASAPDLRLDMSYVQGAWVGTDTEPPRKEVEYFGTSRIWSRRFVRDNDVVDLLITSTGGDRHRAHPPAYCVTGAGWEPVGSRTTEFQLGDGSKVPATLLSLKKRERDMAFCYWFTDGSESHATYAGMMLQDTVRRLGGRRADWLVVRVMTTSGEATLASFLSTFKTGLKAPGNPADQAQESGPMDRH